MLNEVTKHDPYPTRPIPSCIEQMLGAKWFSWLDLAAGYWQVEMDGRDAKKTHFRDTRSVPVYTKCKYKIPGGGGPGPPRGQARPPPLDIVYISWIQLYGSCITKKVFS